MGNVPMTDDEIRAKKIADRQAAARAAQAGPVDTNDGIHAASFTPFAPARSAQEALANARNGYSPDGTQVWASAPNGVAEAAAAAVLDGKSGGVAVRFRAIPGNPGADPMPLVVGSWEDAYYELFDSGCHPDAALDFDLQPDGKHPVPRGRFARAVDPYAITFLMAGCRWLVTAGQINLNKPVPDEALKRISGKLSTIATDFEADLVTALASLYHAANDRGDHSLDEVYEWATNIDGRLLAAASELSSRIAQPARLKPLNPSFGIFADTWGADASKSGTIEACKLTLDDAWALYQSIVAATAGTPDGHAGVASDQPSGGVGDPGRKG